jgi:tetratricopeptide (TPR) repeat protein
MRIFTGMLVVVLVSRAHGAEGNLDALREVIQLPSMTIRVGFGLTGEGEVQCMGEQAGVKAEIAELRATLKGDTSDAPRYLRLAEFHEKLGEWPQAVTANARALELYKKQVRAHPKDGTLLAGLGQALWYADRDEEPEKNLRQAVVLSPGDWRCWVRLGNLLLDKGTYEVKPSSSWLVTGTPPIKFLSMKVKQKPSAAQMAGAKRYLEEAARCFDRAVGAAPKEPEPYLARALFRQARVCTVKFHRICAGKATTVGLEIFFVKGYLADLWQAARLRPGNPRILGLAAVYEVTAFAAQEACKRQPRIRTPWIDLPEAPRQAVQWALGQLREWANSTNRRCAAEASMTLAWVETTIQRDFLAAESYVRRAVELAPERDFPRSLLFVLLLEARRYSELQEHAAQWHQCRKAGYTAFLLAKSYESNNQPLDRIEEAMREALDKYPDGFLPNLGMAAVLMKRKDDPALARAANLLDRAERALCPSPPDEDRAELLVLRGIHCALTGKSAEARHLLKTALSTDPDNKHADVALTVLGGK